MHMCREKNVLWHDTVFFRSLATRDILLKNTGSVPKHTKKLVAQWILNRFAWSWHLNSSLFNGFPYAGLLPFSYVLSHGMFRRFWPLLHLKTQNELYLHENLTVLHDLSCKIHCFAIAFHHQLKSEEMVKNDPRTLQNAHFEPVPLLQFLLTSEPTVELLGGSQSSRTVLLLVYRLVLCRIMYWMCQLRACLNHSRLALFPGHPAPQEKLFCYIFMHVNSFNMV